MGTLNASDKIFATVSYAGRTVLNTSFTGVRSFSDIMDVIKRELGDFIGFVKLKLRNSSQGWSVEHSLRIVSKAPETPKRVTVQPPVQLSLF